MAKNVYKDPGKPPELGADVGTALAYRSPKAVSSSLPEITNFYHTGQGL